MAENGRVLPLVDTSPEDVSLSPALASLSISNPPTAKDKGRQHLPDDIFYTLADHLGLLDLCLLSRSIPLVRREIAPRTLQKQFPIISGQHYKGDASKLLLMIAQITRNMREGTPADVGTFLARIGVKWLSSGVEEVASLLIALEQPSLDSRMLASILTNAMREETTFALSNYTLFVKKLAMQLRSQDKWDSELVWLTLAEAMSKMLWQFVRSAELGNLARRVGLSEEEIERIAGNLAGSYYDDFFVSAERIQAFRDVAKGNKQMADGRLMFFGF